MTADCAQLAFNKFALSLRGLSAGEAGAALAQSLMSQRGDTLGPVARRRPPIRIEAATPGHVAPSGSGMLAAADPHLPGRTDASAAGPRSAGEDSREDNGRTCLHTCEARAQA